MSYINDIIHLTGLENQRRGKICIFAGAGISRNSGIPLAKDIKEYIVGKLCDNNEERNLLLSSQIPFEIFMEIIFKNYHPGNLLLEEFNSLKEDNKEDLSKKAALALYLYTASKSELNEHKPFFTVFDNSYMPNMNHYFIANMLKNGNAKFAITTNFDILIETAYKEITNKELQVYFPDYKGRYKFPCLIKIHGGCQDTETIESTIEKIASNRAQEQCGKIINNVFCKGWHSKILVLGYSFSDIFDISPSIEAVKGSRKDMICINHIKDKNANDIKPIGASQPIFRNFKGWQVNCDTDEIMQALWKVHFDSYRKIDIHVPVTDIDHAIGRWAERFSEPYQKLFICGLLMAYVGRMKEAKYYYEKCLLTNEAITNNEYKLIVLQNLRITDPTNSTGVEHELDILLRNPNINQEEQIKNLLNSVQSMLLQGQSRGALANCRQALEMAQEAGSKRLEGVCCASLAHVYNEIGEYKNALSSAQKALLLLEDINDFEALRIRCRIFCYLAITCENLNMVEKRDEYFINALDLAKKLNIESEMAAAYFSLAHAVNVEVNTKDNLRKSINYFKKGYAFCMGKQAIEPMLKLSAFSMLGAYIIKLYQMDNALVTDDEMHMAYSIMKDNAVSKAMQPYGESAVVETESYLGMICIALHQYDEAMSRITCVAQEINWDHLILSKKKQVLATLLLLFEKQRESALTSSEVKLTEEETTMANEYLEEAYDYLTHEEIVKGIVNISKALQIIGFTYSYRTSVPFIVYKNIMNVQNRLYSLYNSSSSGLDDQDADVLDGEASTTTYV